MHLRFTQLYGRYGFGQDIEDIDSLIFYSHPTSFFAMDGRIPRVIRELITEAEGCLKMNFLTGASACIRKAIYEIAFHEKCEGEDYESKIKSLISKFTIVDASLFDILSHIKDMTSDKIHEQSWDKWDAKFARFIIEALKTTLNEMYVIPAVKSERRASIMKLREEVMKKKESTEKTE